MKTNLEANEISRGKELLRKNFRSLLKEQSEASRSALSLLISKKAMQVLESHPEWKSLASYKAKSSEVNLMGIEEACEKQQRNIFYPKVLSEGLMEFFDVGNKGFHAGAFGISEPIASKMQPAENIDCIFVPALAFDTFGNRLGQGGAYYDRYLAKSKAKKIGVGFSFQVSDDALPEGPFDVKMDIVITDKAVLEMKRESL